MQLVQTKALTVVLLLEKHREQVQKKASLGVLQKLHHLEVTVVSIYGEVKTIKST